MPEKRRRLSINRFYTCCQNLRSFEQELVRLLDFEMISTFLKHPVHLKRYQIFETLHTQTHTHAHTHTYIYIYIDHL